MPTDIRPPFESIEVAAAKVRAAEDVWNTCDPDRVCVAYTEDCVWRNRDRFLTGREEIRAFLQEKWSTELDYRLVKALWGFRIDRMAVRFQYEYRDAAGQWLRACGNHR